MLDIKYAAHVSFIRLQGKWVPWHVTFRSVMSPTEVYVIAADAEDLDFSHDDLKYNRKVYDFPRRKTRTTHVTKDMDDYVHSFYTKTLKNMDWDVLVGAVDKHTARYLGQLLPSVVQLPEKDPGLMATEYVVNEVTIGEKIKGNRWDS